MQQAPPSWRVERSAQTTNAWFVFIVASSRFACAANAPSVCGLRFDRWLYLYHTLYPKGTRQQVRQLDI